MLGPLMGKTTICVLPRHFGAKADRTARTCWENRWSARATFSSPDHRPSRPEWSCLLPGSPRPSPVVAVAVVARGPARTGSPALRRQLLRSTRLGCHLALRPTLFFGLAHLVGRVVGPD